MELTKDGSYISTAVEEVDMINDIKFVFEQFIKTQEKHLSANFLFYIDATNGLLYIGYAEDDTSYLGEPTSVIFSDFWKKNDNAYDFEGGIESAVAKVILPMKINFDSSIKFYCGNDGESEMVEIK